MNHTQVTQGQRVWVLIGGKPQQVEFSDRVLDPARDHADIFADTEEELVKYWSDEWFDQASALGAQAADLLQDFANNQRAAHQDAHA